jgi:hypothetical protein
VPARAINWCFKSFRLVRKHGQKNLAFKPFAKASLKKNFREQFKGLPKKSLLPESINFPVTYKDYWKQKNNLVYFRKNKATFIKIFIDSPSKPLYVDLK